MDTYEGPSEEELYRMEKLQKNTLYGSAGRPNNLMSTVLERFRDQNDPVNHPSHYTDGKIEVIDFIEDKKLGFHLGNAVKYIARAGKKDPAKTVEDLEKAIWYIKRYIEDYKEKDGLNIRNGCFSDLEIKMPPTLRFDVDGDYDGDWDGRNAEKTTKERLKEISDALKAMDKKKE